MAHEQAHTGREIGHLAVWSVNSAKPGNGVEMLRDESTDTFWQSDGIQPHLVNIQFQHKVYIMELQLYLDHKVDESYTPKKISLRAGTALHDLREVRMMELEEPSGWVRVPLSSGDGIPECAPGSNGGELLCAMFLQLAILANHQNGRDTHLRGVRVFGARLQAAGGPPCTGAPGLACSPAAAAMSLYTTIR